MKMLFSTSNLALVVLAACQAVNAHTMFSTLFVDGVGQGDGKCMRVDKDGYTASYPIAGLDSNDMACGRHGTEGVKRVCPTNAGSVLTFEFRSWPGDPTKKSLDPGHKGPCAVYMKKVSNAATDKAIGDGWFKIWDDGFDGQEWCTDKMINNGGRMSVKVPGNLAAGYYLVRPEFLALHAANAGDPQFYANCAQIYLTSTGNGKPSKTVSIPGHVKAGEPAVAFNIYETPMALPYPIPGPEVAQIVSSDEVSVKAVAKQNDGLTPSTCILENANWCGVEVPDYSDETGCWAAAQNCWRQGDDCWHPYSDMPQYGPTTGGKGCELWQQKCQGINNACAAKNFDGPPNKGKILTPKPSSIEIGDLEPTHVGSSIVAAETPKAKGDAVEDTPAPSSPEPQTEPAASSPALKVQPPQVKSASSKAAVQALPSPSQAPHAPAAPVAPAAHTDVVTEVVAAPAPTDGPPVNMHTVYETVVVTDVEYVTAMANGHKHKRHMRDLAARRHMRRGF
ncbi:lytic polysaccharide monooxygenase [Aulographum hederae CBS 113979]|uniref:AA9 family lytic polysaccharide monooxygenase n=1 Tax=Aulographum hederae CBS 113979 TaxID=1176131 RepID=A0A6G1GW10_9PEZI|nr:lytic polysaccharide monooxygenase [Aulographum hederae CBS 113979]